MQTKGRTLKLMSILTLLIVLPASAQAQMQKRRSGTKAPPRMAAFPTFRDPRLYADFSKIKVGGLSLRQRALLDMAAQPSITTPTAKTRLDLTALMKATPNAGIMSKMGTTRAIFAAPALADARSSLGNRFAAGTDYPFGYLSSLAKQRCVRSESWGVGVGAANIAYMTWGDNQYVSLAVGPSKPQLSFSSSKGTCEEPLTGFFVNATAATWSKGASVTWYVGKAPSFERIRSTPTIGASAGYTFKIS